MHEARLVRVVRNKRVYRLQLPRLQLVPNHGPECDWVQEYHGDPAGSLQFDGARLSGFK